MRQRTAAETFETEGVRRTSRRHITRPRAVSCRRLRLRFPSEVGSRDRGWEPEWGRAWRERWELKELAGEAAGADPAADRGWGVENHGSGAARPQA